MQHFKLNDLSDWEEIDVKRGIEFEAIGAQVRRLQFQINAQRETTVTAVRYDPITGEVIGEQKYVATAQGLFAVDLLIRGTTAFNFETDGAVYLRNDDRDHRVPSADLAPFTSSDPGRAVPREIDIVMRAVMENQNRFMAQVQRQQALDQKKYQKLQKELNDARSEKSKPGASEGAQEVVEQSTGKKATSEDAGQSAGEASSENAPGSVKSNE